MSVKIGHASIDENGNAAGGRSGDQTGREVFIRQWYDHPWKVILRPKEKTAAEKIAKAMEQACANDNIGYDQQQRTTCFAEAAKCGFDLSKIKVKCETDCSALVAVCVNAAGIKVSKDIYTGNEKEALAATGKFEVLSESKYTKTSRCLKRGDILLGSGHTAIVLSDGEYTGGGEKKIKASEAPKKFSSSLKKTWVVTADELNVRNGAGTDKKVLTSLPMGSRVICYGYYTEVLETKWLYVQFTYKGVEYVGFASSKYLKQ